MRRSYRYCPRCGGEFSTRGRGRGRLCCYACGFWFFNNPIPVAIGVVPMYHVTLRAFGLPTAGVPDGGLVCVKRRIDRWRSGWCLPYGFVDAHEEPKDAAERKVKEKTGLKVEALKNPIVVCNSGRSNRLMLVYWASPRGGELCAGDDAKDVAVFNYDNMPKLYFPVHVDVAQRYWRGEFQ